MLLLVDIGNTNTVCGIADANSGELVARFRVSSDRDRMSDEWFALLKPLLGSVMLSFSTFSGAIISSVVPSITRQLSDCIERNINARPIIVTAALDLGIEIGADVPAEVGADRLVNAAFGYASFGGPLIIVDLGTATKIEAISGNGDYLGGAIAPGLGLTMDALASRAARLYAVELKAPKAAIGRNTVAAVQSGVVLGHAAMIDGLVLRIQAELGLANHVVLTGGFSHALDGLCSAVTDHRPDLTLSGLHYLFERNRNR